MDAAHEAVITGGKVIELELAAWRDEIRIGGIGREEALRCGSEANVERWNATSTKRSDRRKGMSTATVVGDANTLPATYTQIGRFIPPGRMTNGGKR